MWKISIGVSGLAIAAAGLWGALAGVSAFTFAYGQGHSYLSNNPAVCMNCHIMQPQYDSWLKSSHAAHSGCNDCHLPAGFFYRWTAKAENGFFHSWAFTFQDFHEPIQIKERNLRILQSNCIACHRMLTHQIAPVDASVEIGSCMQCHNSVGHGARSAGMPRRIFR